MKHVSLINVHPPPPADVSSGLQFVVVVVSRLMKSQWELEGSGG